MVTVDSGQCPVIVNNINPVLRGGLAVVNYTLTGATTRSGSGTLPPGGYIAEVMQGERVQRIKLIKSGR